MDYFNSHIYQRIHDIKSIVGDLFNNDPHDYSTPNNNEYNSSYQEELNNITREHQVFHENIERQFNEAIRQYRYRSYLPDTASETEHPIYSNNNQNISTNNTSNEIVNIMPNHIVEEMKSLYESNNKYPDCSICLEELRDFNVLTCGHKFCKACLVNIDKCAFCRKRIQK